MQGRAAGGSTRPGEVDAMRSFWDARARENALWFIHSQLDYAHPDEQEFWRSGEATLAQTLEDMGARIETTDRVLEIGCGVGRMTRALAARSASVVGIDVSSEMVRRGTIALADVANVELRVGNGCDLEGIDDETVDVVYSFVVFQHIPDPAVTSGYIRETGRVLRPGGWTLFQVSELPGLHRRDRWVAVEGSLTNRIGRLLRRRPRGCLDAPWLGSALDRSELLEALDAGGLVLDRTIGDGTQFCCVLAHKA